MCWPWWAAKDPHLCLLTPCSCGMGQKQKNSWVEINTVLQAKEGVMQRQSLNTSHKHTDAHSLSETSLCKHAYCRSWCYMTGDIPLISAIICPGCLCSQHLVHQATSLGKRAEWEMEKVLRLCRYWSTRARTLLCYQYCFSHKIKIQHLRGCHDRSS